MQASGDKVTCSGLGNRASLNKQQASVTRDPMGVGTMTRRVPLLRSGLGPVSPNGAIDLCHLGVGGSSRET